MKANIIKTESGHDLTIHITDKEYVVLKILAAAFEDSEAESAKEIFREGLRADMASILGQNEDIKKFEEYLSCDS